MNEEVDYYFNEDGLMVFTAAYHLKRGYCCKNKCKHCPWNYGKISSQKPTKSKIKASKNNNGATEGN